MGSSLTVREERREDQSAIAAVTEGAFREAVHASGTEAKIVAGLRAAGALAVSLVAELDGRIVGHVAVSPVSISDGSSGWFGLGPISVAPDSQGRGIGTRLMEAALAELRQRDAAGCVLLGDPVWYRRFGFEPRAELRLPGVPAEYFQGVVLAGPMARGEVSYHSAFYVGG